MKFPWDKIVLQFTYIIIGIISYQFFTTSSIYAMSLSQSEVISNNHFDAGLLYWAIGIIGGCIALTLFYVGFRKYNAEKNTVKQRQKKQKHE